MNFYDTLGVTKTSTQEEIKSAYRKLVMVHHPDKGGDKQKFIDISAAYDTLGDPRKRAEYDNPPSNPFEQFGFSFDISDFHEIFGTQVQRNKSIRTVVDLDFLETLNTKSVTVSIPLSSGTESVDLEVPAGVENGAMVSLRGYGDNANPKAPRGNLEILFKVKPHPSFQKINNNLVFEHTIDCIDAMLGTDVTVLLPLTNVKTKINIPAGTQNGTQFGIPNQGFPTINPYTGKIEGRGKFIFKINIVVPTLTGEQIEIIKSIRN